MCYIMNYTTRTIKREEVYNNRGFDIQFDSDVNEILAVKEMDVLKRCMSCGDKVRKLK